MGFLFGALQGMLIVLIAVLLSIPVGAYLAAIFTGRPTYFDRLFEPFEKAVSWVLRGMDGHEMDWKEYVISLLLTNAILWVFSFIVLWSLGMSPDLAFHTASSFTSNTDQQHYSGDTFSPVGQALVLTTLMFFSAATGLVSSFAIIRGLKATDGKIGNFFKDMERSLIRVLIPLSIILALVFVACGIPQSSGGTLDVTTITGAVQSIPLGPVASFESIKAIGTNGGGYYGVNSAHPFENPSPLTNVLELIFTLLIPLALPIRFRHHDREPQAGLDDPCRHAAHLRPGGAHHDVRASLRTRICRRPSNRRPGILRVRRSGSPGTKACSLRPYARTSRRAQRPPRSLP